MQAAERYARGHVPNGDRERVESSIHRNCSLKLNDTMRFRYMISYESDSQPVQTVRREFEVNGGAQAVGQGTSTHWPARRSAR